MLILKKKFKPVFFVHIPRTGGRFLKNLLIQNKYILNFDNFSYHYLNKEIPHLHYPYYNMFNNYGKIKQFLIVRNPVDRFFSMLNASIIKDNLNLNFNTILNNKKQTFEFINQQISKINYHSNWFLPQHFFLGPNCKIWRYENKFDLNFFKWLKKNFNIEIKINKTNWIKEPYDNYVKTKVHKKTINFIREYYDYDFKIFKYK